LKRPASAASSPGADVAGLAAGEAAGTTTLPPELCTGAPLFRHADRPTTAVATAKTNKVLLLIKRDSSGLRLREKAEVYHRDTKTRLEAGSRLQAVSP